MIKMIIVFLAFWAFITGAIGAWRNANNKERWSVVKCAAYGGFTALITLIVIIVIVVLF